MFQAMVREIKMELDRLQCDPHSLECQALLFERVGTMCERLRGHFGREECEWSGRAQALDPAAERWVRQLTDQHRLMEQQMDRICAQIEISLGEAAPLPQAFDQAVRALLTALTTHELSEDRLFQRAIFEELDGA